MGGNRSATEELLDLDSEDLGRIPALPCLNSVTLVKLLKFYDSPLIFHCKVETKIQGVSIKGNEGERRANILLSIVYILLLFCTFLTYEIK